MTATIEASTPLAPFTPHIQAVASGEMRPVRRSPIGKQTPSRRRAADDAATIAVRPAGRSESFGR